MKKDYYKYLDWSTLKKLVAKAKQHGMRGHTVNVSGLCAGKLYPIALAVPHNDGAEMRCQVVMEDGSSFFLDVLSKDYGKLKSIGIPV